MIGSYATTTFKEPWYSQIILPSFNPPSWVFAPVWSILYFLMSFAIWKVWIKSFETKLLKIYFIHLTNINSIYGIPPNFDWKKVWDLCEDYKKKLI